MRRIQEKIKISLQIRRNQMKSQDRKKKSRWEEGKKKRTLKMRKIQEKVKRSLMIRRRQEKVRRSLKMRRSQETFKISLKIRRRQEKVKRSLKMRRSQEKLKTHSYCSIIQIMRIGRCLYISPKLSENSANKNTKISANKSHSPILTRTK